VPTPRPPAAARMAGAQFGSATAGLDAIDYLKWV
jgi:hypothetical protein